MLLNLHERLASTLSQAGRHSDAEQAHRTALAILQKSNREESAQGANLWNGLGTSRVLAGDWLGARVAFEKSFLISESLQTQANLYIASNYAEALAETGDYASAFAIFEPTLARAIEKKESAGAAVLALRAGYAYCGLGQHARCKAMVDIASEHLPRGYPATDYLFARLDLLRSAAATVAGNPADALTYARRAHDGFIARGAPLVVRFRGAGYLATLAAKQGDVALAREALASIASLREQMMAVPKSNAFLGEVLLADATVQMTEGRGQAARPTLVLARDHLLGGAGASALSTRRAAHMLLVD